MIPVMQLAAVRLRINTTRAICRPLFCCRKTAISRARFWRRWRIRPISVSRTRCMTSRPNSTNLLNSGTVLFGVEIPAVSSAAVRRGDRPALLVAADATDPVAAGSALAHSARSSQTALRTICALPIQRRAAVRNPRACALQSGGLDATEHRARSRWHHPDDDHADLHGACRSRARSNAARWRACWPCRSRRSR